MRGCAASPTEEAAESDAEASTTTQTGGFTNTRWTRPAVVPKLPAPVPSRSSLDQGVPQRRPLELPPGLTEISHPCKKGWDALNYKAIEKAQTAAAPWKAELPHAWKDVPLPDADE